MLESFEYGVPPAGWVKTNLLGGSGWYQLPIGVMPLPGWGNGTSSVPPTAGAGSHSAYCSWTTGGGASEGYHSDQWLISPRLDGLTATSRLSFWVKVDFTNFPDSLRVRISTNGPSPGAFTLFAFSNYWARGDHVGQFRPWSNCVVNLGTLGIPAGTPIWVAIQEYEWDNTWSESAMQLDVISSDLTAPPQPRVSPTSLVFTAYYEGSDPSTQTFSIQSIGSSGMGFSRNTAFGAGPTDWLTIGGPSSGTLAFQNFQVFTASVSVAGLDLGAYGATNVFAIPGATNSPIRVPITLNVIRRPQAIAFPNPGAQLTTNKVGLAGTASSGLPVTFSVYSGPGVVVGATNLSFTGTGTVKVIGWQLGNIYYDVAPCVTNSIAVTKPPAAILFTNLSHVYDGSPHGATVTTIPDGLTVDTTYNGSPALPVAIGTYAVTSTVNDALYGGSAVATFTITRMVQTIDFPDPGPQWTTSRVGLAATANSGLPVSFSVASGPGLISGGTNLAFSGAGTVSVVASHPGDANWLPASATNSMEISKVAASVTLNSLNQTYDGTPRVVTATTVPAGLTVDMTYDGSGTAPTAAGSYAVTGTVNDAIYEGANTGTLTVARADQALAFPALPPRLTNAVVALGATANSGLPVTEFSVVSGPGVVNGTNLTFSGAGDVLVRASQSGNGNWYPAAPVTNLIRGFAVNPLGGPAVGGNMVTIVDGELGNVTNVTLCGVPATIMDQGTNWVSVQCAPGTPGTGDLLIQSGSDIVVSNAYTYNPTGTIFAVAPGVGSYVGGFPVVITGTNLCGDGDVTNVTLCGAVAAPVSQSATQIVVTAGAGAIGLGDVRVFSAGFGETVASDAFTYAISEMRVLGTNGGLIVNDEPADASRGADFGSRLVLGGYTNWFAITNSGDAALTILDVATNGPASAFFGARDVPANVPPGSSASFSIVYEPVSVGAHSAAIELLNDSTNTPYRINLAGTALKRDQDALVFVPASPQTYGSTNELSVAGGSGTGAVAYAVVSGPGAIVEGSHLVVTAGAGTVIVRATKEGDDFYQPQSVSGTVTAAKADQAIEFAPLGAQVATNRVGLSAGSGSGLPVAFAVVAGPAAIAGGTNLTFSAEGQVEIRATQDGDTDWNAAPAVTNSLAVSRAVAVVELGDLDQSYDGSPKPVTVATVPAGLAVAVTYDGAAAVPLDVGTYAVTALVSEALYAGSAAGTLTVGRGWQTINFPPIPNQRRTNVVHLAAASSAGLPVVFGVQAGAASITNGTNLSFSGFGRVEVLATQAGDARWNPASATQSFLVASPAPLDFDGDGVTDLGVFRTSDSNWYVYRSGEGEMTPFLFGLPGDERIPADYDGDGLCDAAVFRPATATWYIFGTATGAWVPLRYGAPGDQPIPADYDGDGSCDLAVLRPSSMTWYVYGSSTGAVTPFVYGAPGDQPIPADYDGDGLADPAVFRPGTATWYILGTSRGPFPAIQYGALGDLPVPGDYDGDGVLDYAVFRPSAIEWYVFGSEAGQFTPFLYGAYGDVPLLFPQR